MTIKRFVLGPVQANCYILACEESRKAVIIDPGDRSREALSYIEENSYEQVMIINTHGHFDHIGGNQFFSSGKIPVAAHRLEFERIRNGGDSRMFGMETEKSPEPSVDLSETATVEFGMEKLQVIHTPGHTAGHVSLYHSASGSLFCGDVLFFRSIGRSDLPGGSHRQLLDSIKNRLYRLPDDTKVYPGHGQETTIGDEKKHNPWTAG